MNESTCIRCKRVNKSINGKCNRCRPIAVDAQLKILVCEQNRCGHFGVSADHDRGCLHPGMGKACQTRDHFLRKGGCVADPKRFEGDSIRRDRPVLIDSLTSNQCDQIDEVALITFHFNPMGYRRLRDTYQQWLPTLGPLAKSLRCYELAFDHNQPEIDGSIVIRGTTAANLMWQKEALINRAIRETPPEVKYIVWLDHDIVFQEQDWLNQAIAKIDEGNIAVQLFDQLYYFNQRKTIHRTTTSAMSKWSKTKKSMGAPGGAWIADRQYLDDIGGLIDTAIVGGGDQSFHNAIIGHQGRYLRGYSKPLAQHHRDWIQNAIQVKGDRRATHLPIEAYHLWHGDKRNRQHRTRDAILSRASFDPQKDIRQTPEGIHEWCSAKPALHQSVQKFFRARREDG